LKIFFYLIPKLFIFILVITIISGCKNTTQNNVSNNSKLHDRLEIYLERGAFEYDSFSLKDTILTYHPSESGFKKDSIYNQKLTKHITKQQKDSLLEYMNNHRIYDNPQHYTNQTTDNSLLQITIKRNQKVTRISCADFQRGCPDNIRYFEQLFIKWIGVDVKRKVLPG